MKVAVLGAGAGALAVAADMSRHGRHTVMADFDDVRATLAPVAERGGVTFSNDSNGPTTNDGNGVASNDGNGPASNDGNGPASNDGNGAATNDGNGPTTHPVTAATIPEALDRAELAVVVVPCTAHERWVQAIAPHITADQTLLFLGGDGGAIVARRAIEPPTTIAEANTLPHLARSSGPGAVSAFRKLGGVLIAALPSTPRDTARVMELIGDVWPYAAATDTVWSTVLSNYNAIDRVASVVANAGTRKDRTGGMPRWGEEATPAVENVIEAVDAELLALRRALNSKESRRYREFLVAQGFAPDLAPEDVPCALVLASSLGEAAWVPTPAIDTLVAAASAMLGQDFRAEGRTLATLGLDGLDVTGLVGFARTGVFP